MIDPTTGLDFPDRMEALRITLRLVSAAVFSGLIGWQRERAGKSAGLRTHVLVGLGTAFFIVAAAEAGIGPGDMSRVIQGLATGIGFIGAGAILKLDQEKVIKGLTTAASLWMTAAIGVAAGLGELWAAALGAVLTWIVLGPAGLALEKRIDRHRVKEQEPE